MVKASEKHLSLLYDLMHKELVKKDVLHADETVLEVLREPGEKRVPTATCGCTERDSEDTCKPMDTLDIILSESPGEPGVIQVDVCSCKAKVCRCKESHFHQGDSDVCQY